MEMRFIIPIERSSPEERSSSFCFVTSSTFSKSDLISLTLFAICQLAESRLLKKSIIGWSPLIHLPSGVKRNGTPIPEGLILQYFALSCIRDALARLPHTSFLSIEILSFPSQVLKNSCTLAQCGHPSPQKYSYAESKEGGGSLFCLKVKKTPPTINRTVAKIIPGRKYLF